MNYDLSRRINAEQRFPDGVALFVGWVRLGGFIFSDF